MIPLLAILGLLFVALSAVQAQPEPPRRVLIFPADRPVGFLRSRPAGNTGENIDQALWADFQPRGQAVGIVPIPAGDEVELTIIAKPGRDLSWIRRLHPNDITVLSIRGEPLSDADFDSLLHLSGLRSFIVSGTCLTEAQVQKLDAFSKLRSLELSGAGLGDVIAAKAPSFARLESLRFSSSGLTDAGMSHLGKLHGLRSLTLHSENVTDAGIVQLAGLTNLETLNLMDLPDVKNPAIFERMQKLTFLVLFRAGANDAIMPQLAGLKQLRNLHLGDGVTDAGVVHLAGLHAMNVLHLPMNSGDEALKIAASVPALKSLTTGMNTTNNGLTAIAALTNLEFLDLSGRSINDAGMKHLTGLTNLKYLRLMNADIGDEGYALLANNPNLETVWLGHHCTGKSIALLSQLPKLKELYFYIRDRKPDLSGIARCHALEEVWIMSPFDDTELRHFAGLKNLRSLRLSRAPVTDAAIEHLLGLSNLTTLDMDQSNLTDAGLGKLAELTNLESLSVAGNITDEGLALLTPMRNLRHLSLSTRFTSAEARDALQAKLPLVSISLSHMPQPKIGEPAPDFTTLTLDGKNWRLSDQRGKIVFLQFWGTWCGPCVATMPAIKEFHDTLGDRAARFASISLSTDMKEETLRRYVEEKKHSWPQSHIAFGKLASNFGLDGVPLYLVIDADGKVTSVGHDWNKALAAINAGLNGNR